jgi:hypothetical protein
VSVARIGTFSEQVWRNSDLSDRFKGWLSGVRRSKALDRAGVEIVTPGELLDRLGS